MYSFKRNAVQAVNVVNKEAWSLIDPIFGDTNPLNISPRLENTILNTDRAELTLRIGDNVTQVSTTNGQRYAFGIPFGLVHTEERYHYEVSGTAVVHSDTASGASLVPYWSYHTAPLTAAGGAKENTTTYHRRIAHRTSVRGNSMVTSVATSIILEAPEAIMDVGHSLVFGWSFNQNTGQPRDIRATMDMSVKKFVANIDTYDPHK